MADSWKFKLVQNFTIIIQNNIFIDKEEYLDIYLLPPVWRCMVEKILQLS